MRHFIIILSIFCCFNALAQSNDRRGYAGNVEIGGRASCGKNQAGGQFDIISSNGFNYGDGAFVGIGIGIEKFIGNKEFCIPLFVEMKYSFLKSDVSPFVSARAGLEYTTDDCVFCAVNPSIGVDMHRFFVRMGYYYRGGSQGIIMLKGSQVGFSFGIHF